MTNADSSIKRRIWPAPEQAYTLFEKASEHGFSPLPLRQALDIVIRQFDRRQRLPKHWRDALLASLARAKAAILCNTGCYIEFVCDDHFDDAFVGAAALVTFWAERPEDTARRSTEYIREMHKWADYLRWYAQQRSVGNKETARIIREYEQRERRARSARVA